jgi:hypothetical protein
MLAGALLRSHLHHAIVAGRGFHHMAALHQGVRKGLLLIHIFAGLVGVAAL